jgi:two-component system KDP operon response regulator KdpE
MRSAAATAASDRSSAPIAVRRSSPAARGLLSHATLLRRVWGVGYETETEYIRVYVRRLRSKLEVAGGPPLIVTEPRAGYRLLGG